MDKIYKNQSLKIKVEVELTTLADVATILIKYEKPESGEEGSWTGSVFGDVTDGIIVYDCEAGDGSVDGDLDEIGVWKIWGEVTYNSGAYYVGEKTEIKVWLPGT